MGPNTKRTNKSNPKKWRHIGITGGQIIVPGWPKNMRKSKVSCKEIQNIWCEIAAENVEQCPQGDPYWTRTKTIFHHNIKSSVRGHRIPNLDKKKRENYIPPNEKVNENEIHKKDRWHKKKLRRLAELDKDRKSTNSVEKIFEKRTDLRGENVFLKPMLSGENAKEKTCVWRSRKTLRQPCAAGETQNTDLRTI